MICVKKGRGHLQSKRIKLLWSLFMTYRVRTVTHGTHRNARLATFSGAFQACPSVLFNVLWWIGGIFVLVNELFTWVSLMPACTFPANIISASLICKQFQARPTKWSSWLQKQQLISYSQWICGLSETYETIVKGVFFYSVWTQKKLKNFLTVASFVLISKIGNPRRGKKSKAKQPYLTSITRNSKTTDKPEVDGALI